MPLFSESSLKLIYFVGSERAPFDDSVVQATTSPAEYSYPRRGRQNAGTCMRLARLAKLAPLSVIEQVKHPEASHSSSSYHDKTSTSAEGCRVKSCS